MRKIFIQLLALLPGAAIAHGYAEGDLAIAHPIVFETPATAQSGAGYLTIFNHGDTDDQLLVVKADFPRVMLHQTEVTDGIAKMTHVDSIKIPAREVVALEPGGMHVMFMRLAGDPFTIGEEFEATLVFEKAGEMHVVFKVEARPGDSVEIDHSGH
ncbi:MAG: copper chaperone PCu(A)C [Pseudomonadota bacterium]